MLQTYELILVGRDGERHFQPLLSNSELDACAQARKALDDPQIAEAELSRCGVHLITFYPADSRPAA